MGMDTFRDWTELNGLWDAGQRRLEGLGGLSSHAQGSRHRHRGLPRLPARSRADGRDGHEVVGVDTGFYKHGWLYNGVPQTARTLAKDIRHITAEDLEGVDAIVHMAELSNDPLGELLAEHHLRRSTTRARCGWPSWPSEAGVERFVYMSSCSVYGVADGDGRRDQRRSTRRPRTPSARPWSSATCAALADDDFSPTFLRNATAFGASPRQRFDIVLNNLSGLAWTTKKIAMTSDGTPWRPLVHGLDIAKAIRCALDAPREAVHNEIFNVGSDEQNYQVREIAEIVGDGLPRLRGHLRRPPAATTAATRSTSTRSASSCPASRATGTPQRGAAPAARGLQPHRHGRRDLHRPRPHPAQAARAPDRAPSQVDAELFWTTADRVIITTTAHRRASSIIDLELRERRPRLLRPHLLPRGVRAPPAWSPPSSSATCRSTTRAGTLRGHALPGRRRTRRPSSCAAPRARSSTSSSTCARTRRPTAAARRGRAHRGQPARAATCRRTFAHGYQTLADDTEVHLPGQRRLHARRRARAALRRPGARHAAGRCRSTVISDKDAAWPLLAEADARRSRDAADRVIIVDTALAAARRPRATRSGSPWSAPGFMGRGLVNQIVNSRARAWSSSADRATAPPASAERAYREAGVDRRRRSSTTPQALDRGGRRRACRRSPTTPRRSPTPTAIDAVVDVTGAVEFGAHVVAGGDRARQARRPDERRGRRHRRADPAPAGAEAAGVVLTGCDGDQPGVQMNLFRFVRGIGLTPAGLRQHQGPAGPVPHPDHPEGASPSSGARTRTW